MLARLSDIQTSYIGMDGKRKAASPEALRRVLASMGVLEPGERDLEGAIRRCRLEPWRRRVQPVHVAWDGRSGLIEYCLPPGRPNPAIEWRLELEDGTLYVASQFVAGAGGCTSTSLKDMDEAMRGLGKIRLKVETDLTRGGLWHELQVRIRHPNFSGMQIDTRTNAYTPAKFIDMIDVDVGTKRLLSIESGIAISEDPNFRLTFAKPEPASVTIVARPETDT